jgi:hypothetical protein
VTPTQLQKIAGHASITATELSTRSSSTEAALAARATVNSATRVVAFRGGEKAANHRFTNTFKLLPFHSIPVVLNSVGTSRARRNLFQAKQDYFPRHILIADPGLELGDTRPDRVRATLQSNIHPRLIFKQERVTRQRGRSANRTASPAPSDPQGRALHRGKRRSPMLFRILAPVSRPDAAPMNCAKTRLQSSAFVDTFPLITLLPARSPSL